MTDMAAGDPAGSKWTMGMSRTAFAHFLFLNIGHFLDHYLMLIFATVAALVLTTEWGLTYADLIHYATPGFVAFGLFSLPAGWIADRWTREGMIGVFFIGIGLASFATGFATTPLQIGLGLFVVGVLAAIYHPVGLALIAKDQPAMGLALAVNGVWGNLGVGIAALATGYLIDYAGWRAAFWVPGALSAAIGIAYFVMFHERIWAGPPDDGADQRAPQTAGPHVRPVGEPRFSAVAVRLTIIILLLTAIGSIIFQATTFALPKVFEERIGEIASSATAIGWVAFCVFAIASLAQVVVGLALDRVGPRRVFLVLSVIQLSAFLVMPGSANWMAIAAALVFMVATFGQIPICDYMIGRLAAPKRRAQIYGARFAVVFIVLAATLPLVSWMHANFGFDVMFYALGVAAVMLLATAALLPAKLPNPSELAKA